LKTTVFYVAQGYTDGISGVELGCHSIRCRTSTRKWSNSVRVIENKK